MPIEREPGQVARRLPWRAHRGHGRRTGVAIALLACVLAPCVSAATAATRAAMPSVRLQGFVEEQVQQVNVGGVPVLGVTTDGATEADSLSPALRVPAALVAAGTPLCIRTTSVDRGYTSHGEVAAADLANVHGRFRLDYRDRDDPRQSRFEEALHRYHPVAVATMAIVGGCDGTTQANRIVVIDRRPADSRDATLLMQVNTSQYDIDLRYSTRDGVEHEVSCHPLGGELRRLAFSSTCRLAGPFPDTIPVTLLRSRYGHAVQPLTFTLFFPDADVDVGAERSRP